MRCDIFWCMMGFMTVDVPCRYIAGNALRELICMVSNTVLFRQFFKSRVLEWVK